MTRRTRILSLVTILTLVTTYAIVSAKPAAIVDRRAELAPFQHAPGDSGPQIYEGRVDSLGAGQPATLYRYERRVRDSGIVRTSTHITREPGGTVVVVQRAENTPTYDVTRAELIHGQTGVVAAVDVAGQQAVFTLTKDGRTSTKTETLHEPLVAGPTMFGFIVAHWDELARGVSIPVRFAVLERGESIRFALDMVPSPAGHATVRMRPTNWLVRLAVAPTYFEFDSTRKVQGYTGRVPPMDTSRGQLKTLDARVTYTYLTPTFR